MQKQVLFLPTPSARRATSPGWAAPVRMRPFLPTPSARRATYLRDGARKSQKYFYPRPPRGGRPQGALVGPGEVQISTHALREEGDITGALRLTLRYAISTHALREEGDSKCAGK